MTELQNIEERLARIEDVLMSLKLPKREKYFYTTAEAASRLGLSKWYTRKLCAEGKILAEKHPESGRFMISADELRRIESRRDVLE